jgi:DNA-binding response OmpR family regulator
MNAMNSQLPKGPETGPKARILLIDDDFRLLTTLGQLLVKEGYEVQNAENGEEGIQIQRKQPSDLIITDLIMPGKEGIETIAELRKAQPSLKIIAMSGGGLIRSTEYLMVAETIGANCTIAKPFPFDRLLSAVEELLS